MAFEDYGGPGDQEAEEELARDKDKPRRDSQGKLGDVSRPGEQFGEFDDTGTGTDLTADMANTDVREDLAEHDELTSGDDS